jgi:hypothetical protein
MYLSSPPQVPFPSNISFFLIVISTINIDVHAVKFHADLKPLGCLSFVNIAVLNVTKS